MDHTALSGAYRYEHLICAWHRVPATSHPADELLPGLKHQSADSERQQAGTACPAHVLVQLLAWASEHVYPAFCPAANMVGRAGNASGSCNARLRMMLQSKRSTCAARQ